jgi:predicted permease
VRLGFEYRLQFVTRLATGLAVPCLVFTALMKTTIDADALREVMIATFAAYVVLAVLAFVALRVTGQDMRTYLAPIVSGNTGNLGLPLCLFAFGETGFAYAVVVFAITSILAFTVGVWIVSGGGSVRKAFREPLVWATLGGMLFMVMGWQTPFALTRALDLIGQMAIPMMLITLGVAVARLQVTQLGRAIFMSIFKIGLCITVAVGAGWAFNLAPLPSAILIVQFSMPFAVTSYLLAEKYGADAQSVAAAVVVSTLLTVPISTIVLSLVMFA